MATGESPLRSTTAARLPSTAFSAATTTAANIATQLVHSQRCEIAEPAGDYNRLPDFLQPNGALTRNLNRKTSGPSAKVRMGGYGCLLVSARTPCPNQFLNIGGGWISPLKSARHVVRSAVQGAALGGQRPYIAEVREFVVPAERVVRSDRKDLFHGIKNQEYDDEASGLRPSHALELIGSLGDRVVGRTGGDPLPFAYHPESPAAWGPLHRELSEQSTDHPRLGMSVFRRCGVMIVPRQPVPRRA